MVPAPATIVVHGTSGRRGPGSVRFLAPDLRGRACSRSAPGPYGLGTHAQDVLAIADVVGARPVLVGHSMGAFVTALASSQAPEKVAGSVLVDGGFAFPPPADLDIDKALTAVIGPAMTRPSMRFESPDAYLAFWRDHPALGPALAGPQGAEVRRYVPHDLVQIPGGDWVSSCVVDAIRAAWGLMNEVQGLYDEHRIAALGLPESIVVTPVRDVNHYTAALGAAGAGAIVDALERRLDEASSSAA